MPVKNVALRGEWTILRSVFSSLTLSTKLTEFGPLQEWKSFDIDLFTGSNFEMINVTRVAMGLDGTNASRTNYSFPCPEVDPPAPIYFYQFTSDGQDPTWTQRFSIAAPNGTLVSLLYLDSAQYTDADNCYLHLSAFRLKRRTLCSRMVHPSLGESDPS